MFDARYHGSEIAALAWYRSYLVVYMGIVMKKKVVTCHLCHHGTEPLLTMGSGAMSNSGVMCSVACNSHV